MVRVRICVKDDTQDQRLPFGASGSVAFLSAEFRGSGMHRSGVSGVLVLSL